MANRSYTVLIVPERSSKVRRLKIPQQLLVRAALGVFALVALSGFMGVHYLYIVDQASQNSGLKDENVTLKTRLRLLQEEIARVDGTLQRIEQFTARVRSITQLNDPERNLAIGPLSDENEGRVADVLYAKGERIEFEDELIDSKMALRIIESSLDKVEGDAVRQERAVRELAEYLGENEPLLATTPSLRPTASKLLTSSFGIRTDPYTEHRVMHKGIDFAADHGADVVAPADGVVIFVGTRGQGYGKTVVMDHGYGIQTHYAHLSSFKVDIGQPIKRGQIIAAVGNTGRSTGAHLHYEVRFNGVPQDPEKFILD